MSDKESSGMEVESSLFILLAPRDLTFLGHFALSTVFPFFFFFFFFGKWRGGRGGGGGVPRAILPARRRLAISFGAKAYEKF